jgi:hypothetical protein
VDVGVGAGAAEGWSTGEDEWSANVWFSDRGSLGFLA